MQIDQDELIEAVAHVAGETTAVVAVSPGALLTPWRHNVGAVLAAFMPGEPYGSAIASVLFGDVNPSGRLPVTFPDAEAQQPFAPAAYPGLANGSVPIQVNCGATGIGTDCPSRGGPPWTWSNGTSTYSERLLVGYRYYTAHALTPALCFGHGLSYTAFRYSALKLSPSLITFTLENTGSVAGAEVAQLYLEFPAAAHEPPLQLKGFQKLRLNRGEAREVRFPLAPRDLSIWDVEAHGWALVPGEFRAHVGASSCDLRLRGSFRR